MQLNKKQSERLRQLSQSTKGTFLLEFLELVKDEVSDVRTNLTIKTEHDKEVRLAVCEVIENLIVKQIKRLQTTDSTFEGNDNWN